MYSVGPTQQAHINGIRLNADTDSVPGVAGPGFSEYKDVDFNPRELPVLLVSCHNVQVISANN